MDTYSLWIFTIGDIMGLSPQSGGPRLVTEGLTPSGASGKELPTW